MKCKIFVLAICLLGFAGFTQAQTATPGITKTQIDQQQRIKQGLKSGSLTKAEVKKLEKQQVQIQKMKIRSKADGVVTRKEKARINAAQTNASARIFKQKHDRQRRIK